MSNLLLLHEGEQPTLLGIYKFFLDFFEVFDGDVKKKYAKFLTKEELAWADVIICVRGESPQMYSILQYAKSIEKKIFYYLDDDLKDIPKGDFRYPKRKKWLLKCIKEASLIWSSNQLIVDEYIEFTEEHRGAITHTAVKAEEIVLVPSDSDSIKLVYAASEGHISNFNRYIRPLLMRVFDKYGRKIEFYLIGLRPKIEVGQYKNQIHFIDPMPLKKYEEFMRTHHFDIGLAPLEPTHFTERKYFNKYIEYTKVGICGIYSDVMPFKLAVKDGWNGYMTENTLDSWMDTMIKAIDDREKREILVQNAQNHLRNEHSETVIFSKLVKDIPELIEYNAPELSIKWPFYIYRFRLRQIYFRICETLYLTIYSLHHFGIKTTMDKINRKIARRKI